MLWAVLCANYDRIEASYHQVDLMDLSSRKLLNLTFGWLFDLIGGTEEWKKHYEHVFDESQHSDFDYVELPQGSSGLIIGGV